MAIVTTHALIFVPHTAKGTASFWKLLYMDQLIVNWLWIACGTLNFCYSLYTTLTDDCIFVVCSLLQQWLLFMPTHVISLTKWTNALESKS